MGTPPGAVQDSGGGARQRQRIDASTQQRSQYRDCSQATKRLRSRVTEMNRTINGAGPAGVTHRLRQQLRTELRSMQQEQERLRTKLTAEQQALVQEHLGNMERDREELMSLSDALEFELDQLTPDETKVHTQLRDMDRLATNLEKQQQKLGSELEMK